jgi:hypothetical protein
LNWTRSESILLKLSSKNTCGIGGCFKSKRHPTFLNPLAMKNLDIVERKVYTTPLGVQGWDGAP